MDIHLAPIGFCIFIGKYLPIIYLAAVTTKNTRQLEMMMHVNNMLHSTGSAPAPMQVANKLEQAFLEEMLKYCGPAARQGEFSGGAGEDQFNSFLTREYSARLADRLDLGFASAMQGAKS